jgi:hypothetical protein
MVGLIATIVGIAFPFLILYVTLEGYDSRFKDNHLFISILVPLIFGTVVSLFHIGLGFSPLLFTAFPLVIVSLTILETAARELFLRAKRFRGDPALPIYGLSVGLWMGAMLIFGRIYVHLMSNEPDAIDVAALGLFAVTAALVHGALGMEAGRRPRGEWRSLGIQIGIGCVFNTVFLMFYIFLQLGTDSGVLMFMAMCAGGGYFLFIWEREGSITSCIPRDDEDWEMYPGGEPASSDDFTAKKRSRDVARRYEDGDEVDVTPRSGKRKHADLGPKGAGKEGAKRSGRGPRIQARRLHRSDRSGGGGTRGRRDEAGKKGRGAGAGRRSRSDDD